MLQMVYDDFKKNIEKMKNLLNDSLTNNEIKKPLSQSYFEDDGIKIKFDIKKIEKTLDAKNSKFINIDNIKIKNIGNKSYKNLYFFKDNINSSKEINFFGNSKKIDEYELSLYGEVKPNTSFNGNACLNIINAKPEKIYKMIIYVRERGQDKNISEALEINIKIKRDLEQERINKANKIYEEIKKDFPENEQLINKKEIISKLLNNNFNKDLIKNEIKNKIDKVKAEKISKELDLEIEKKKKEKAEPLYNKLIKLDNINFSKSSKDSILKKIIESDFNEDYLINFYSTDEVDRIYAELEQDYGISFMEKEVKEKIRELKLDRALINEWIEDKLING